MPKCYNFWTFHTLLICVESLLLILKIYFLLFKRGTASLWEAQSPYERPILFCERPSLPMWGPTLLWEAQATMSKARPSCERRCTSVSGLATLWRVQPPCKRPCLSVRGQASLWECWPPCERPRLPVRGPASLWEALPPCERKIFGHFIYIMEQPSFFLLEYSN